MPTNNVDLTAILPSLKAAIEPFEAAMKAAQQMKINPATKVRNFASISEIPLGDVQRLVDNVNAVRRLAGDIR